MVEIRWHGRGGQGAFTAARILGEAASICEGKYAQAFPSFGPERRGAPVLAFTRINTNKISDRSEVEQCDCVVVLDETLYGPTVTNGLKNNGVLIINSPRNSEYFSDKEYRVTTIDATALSLAALGRNITNIPMLGALAAVSSLVNVESLLKVIDSTLAPALRAKNKCLLKNAFDSVKKGMKS
jgi:pyruvate ferredoxin oxidoreductase gamma subunit